MRHIVDELIEERATRLMRHPLLWRLVRAAFYPLLGYRDAVRMADTIAERSAAETFRYLSALLELDVRCTGLDYVPPTGPAVVTPNHPAGIADGIAVYDALINVREDITFFANRDALRVAPRLADMVVPVEWVDAKRDHARNRETVRHMVEAFRQDRLVVIFPAGRLARPTLTGLRERPWQPTAFGLAQRYRAPVLPMHIRAHNSWLYYCLYFLNEELKNMTLFRELLNKHAQPYRITIGAPIVAAGDPRELAEQVCRFVTEALPYGTSSMPPGPTCQSVGAQSPQRAP